MLLNIKLIPIQSDAIFSVDLKIDQQISLGQFKETVFEIFWQTMRHLGAKKLEGRSLYVIIRDEKQVKIVDDVTLRKKIRSSKGLEAVFQVHPLRGAVK